MDNDNISYTDQGEQKLPFMYGVIDDTVNVPRNEYEDLLERSAFLAALEDSGVDNWEWYDEAVNTYNERNEDV